MKIENPALAVINFMHPKQGAFGWPENPDRVEVKATFVLDALKTPRPVSSSLRAWIFDEKKLIDTKYKWYSAKHFIGHVNQI